MFAVLCSVYWVCAIVPVLTFVCVCSPCTLPLLGCNLAVLLGGMRCGSHVVLSLCVGITFQSPRGRCQHHRGCCHYFDQDLRDRLSPLCHPAHHRVLAGCAAPWGLCFSFTQEWGRCWARTESCVLRSRNSHSPAYCLVGR